MNINHVDVERNGDELPRRQVVTSGPLHPGYYLHVLKNIRVLNQVGIHVLWQQPFMMWLLDKLYGMMVPFRQDNLGRHLPERVHTNCNPSPETN